MTERRGVCPGCEIEGAIGAPCPQDICARRGLHFIPEDYAIRYAEAARLEQDPLIGTVIDDWLLVELLGEGGFGKVYLVLQRPLFRLRAALKVMRPRDANDAMAQRLLLKFRGEAEALAGLNHPNIVRLLDYDVWEDNPFLVMEYVEGARDLAIEMEECLWRDEAFPRVRALNILRQLLNGLESAHRRNVVHRDIKPDNIMLQAVAGEPDLVRILDFGLAKFLGESSETSVAMGTPVYIAPEQLSRRHIGPWTDLYAVAVMTFELMTGYCPFPRESQDELLGNKLDPDYDPISRLPNRALPENELLFYRRALAVQPGDRYRDVPTFRAALEAAFPEWAGGGERDTVPDDAIGTARTAREISAPTPHTVAVSIPATTAPAVPATGANRWWSRWPYLAGAGGLLVALALALVLVRPNDGGASSVESHKPAMLLLRSDPRGAEVVCLDDGRKLGQAPIRLSALEGDVCRRVRLSAPNRWPVERTLALPTPGVIKEVVVPLAAPPAVRITTEPPGAEVSLADASLGVTPFTWTVPPTLANGVDAVALSVRLRGHRTEAVPAAAADLRRGAPLHVELTPWNPADLDWVPIPGGSFEMGSVADGALGNEAPVHGVTVAAFELTKHEVTVAQYRRCVEAGACTAPGQDGYCNWGISKRNRHPINCVDWEQARQFGEWAGGRLPTEAEWEYAARSGGRARPFPWGDTQASCRRAVLGEGCGKGRATWRVCAMRRGNSAQGVCDLAGNVAEWVADCWHDTYRGAPTDGTAWRVACEAGQRVVRGGSWIDAAIDLRATARAHEEPTARPYTTGIRLAR